jgi:hypothetical protein
MIQPPDYEVLLPLAVVTQNFAAVQLSADLSPRSGLGDAEPGQYARIGHVGLAQLSKPCVGLAGIADRLLDCLFASLGVQVPKRDLGMILNDRQHCLEGGVPGRWRLLASCRLPGLLHG